MMIKSIKLIRHATIHQPVVLPNTSQEPKVLGQNIQSRVLSTCTVTGEKGDKTLSFVPSDLFFQGNEIEKDVHPRGEKGDGNHSSALGSTHDEDQKYWLKSTEKYNDVVEDRPKVLSSMALPTKIFWEKLLRADKLKPKKESGQLPANCGSLKTKRLNKEDWVTLGTKFADCKLQLVQILQPFLLI